MVLTDKDLAERPLTVKDVAKYLQISEPTVFRLLKSGELPAAKIGRQWRITRKAIDDYLLAKSKKEEN